MKLFSSFVTLKKLKNFKISCENPSLEDTQLENYPPQGSAKFWIGKDYTNFIVKDFVDLDKPAQGLSFCYTFKVYQNNYIRCY